MPLWSRGWAGGSEPHCFPWIILLLRYSQLCLMYYGHGLHAIGFLCLYILFQLFICGLCNKASCLYLRYSVSYTLHHTTQYTLYNTIYNIHTIRLSKKINEIWFLQHLISWYTTQNTVWNNHLNLKRYVNTKSITLKRLKIICMYNSYTKESSNFSKTHSYFWFCSLNKLNSRKKFIRVVPWIFKCTVNDPEGIFNVNKLFRINSEKIFYILQTSSL